MIYRDLLKTYGVHLFDEDRDQFPFNDYAWFGGWEWWDSQPFRNEGLVRHKTTGKYFRLTSTIEMRGRLQCRIYKIGVEMDEKTIFENELPDVDGPHQEFKIEITDHLPKMPFNELDAEVKSMLSQAGKKGGAKGRKRAKVNKLPVHDMAGAR